MRVRARWLVFGMLGGLGLSSLLACRGAQPAPEPPAPAALSAEARRGGELYVRMCAVCHGERGEGYKADQAPALAHPEFLGSVSDKLLRSSIMHGRAGTTMSAWGHQHGGPLVDADVEAVIAFMRSWQSGKPRVLDERAPQGDAATGAALYAAECARCHGPSGREGPHARLTDAAWLADASNGFVRHAIGKGRDGTLMPGFQEKLKTQGIDHVLVWLRAQAAPVPVPPRAPAAPPPLPLGPVPLNPKGPEPQGFSTFPKMTSVAVVAAQLQAGARMALLDARAPSDYTRDHIAGAVSVPFYDPTPYLQDLPKDAWLVCYCGCPHAESGQLAQKLQAAGFTKVTVLDEGLGVWKEQGHATRAGAGP